MIPEGHVGVLRYVEGGMRHQVVVDEHGSTVSHQMIPVEE